MQRLEMGSHKCNERMMSRLVPSSPDFMSRLLVEVKFE